MYTPEQISHMSLDDAKKEARIINEMELYDTTISGLTEEEMQTIYLYHTCLKHRIADLKKKLPYRTKEVCINLYHRILNF